jgi:hypothetical protein
MKSELLESGAAELSKAEGAEQIAVEASQLARLANTNGFELLSRLIDMVVLEAWREATEPRSSGDGDSFPIGEGT